MSSSTAQLGGGPVQLIWPAQDGKKIYDSIAGIRQLLHRTRGRDCPDHLWDPDKRYTKEMKYFWCAFLELRTTTRERVHDVKEHGLSRRYYEGNPKQVIDQRGNVVSLDEAVATYLRSLPPALIPIGAAPRFLTTEEEDTAQREFLTLNESVTAYIPDFQEWQSQMKEDQKRDLDASNALHRLCCLNRRFGDFTLGYRESRLRPKTKGSRTSSSHEPYNMGSDIQQRVSEVVTLSRWVGPIERATLLLWQQRVVPPSVSLSLPGNVVHFLNQFREALDPADVEMGFQHVLNLLTLADPSATKLTGLIQHALADQHQKNNSVILALLRAFLLSKPPINQCRDPQSIKEALTLNQKRLLRLDNEYENDLRLLQAIQAQV